MFTLSIKRNTVEPGRINTWQWEDFFAAPTTLRTTGSMALIADPLTSAELHSSRRIDVTKDRIARSYSSDTWSRAVSSVSKQEAWRNWTSFSWGRAPFRTCQKRPMLASPIKIRRRVILYSSWLNFLISLTRCWLLSLFELGKRKQ